MQLPEEIWFDSIRFVNQFVLKYAVLLATVKYVVCCKSSCVWCWLRSKDTFVQRKTHTRGGVRMSKIRRREGIQNKRSALQTNIQKKTTTKETKQGQVSSPPRDEWTKIFLNIGRLRKRRFRNQKRTIRGVDGWLEGSICVCLPVHLRKKKEKTNWRLHCDSLVSTSHGYQEYLVRYIKLGIRIT